MRTPFVWFADFVKKQKNFRVLLARKLGYSFLGRLSRQYTSLYAIASGARVRVNKQELKINASFGNTSGLSGNP